MRYPTDAAESNIIRSGQMDICSESAPANFSDRLVCVYEIFSFKVHHLQMRYTLGKCCTCFRCQMIAESFSREKSSERVVCGFCFMQFENQPSVNAR